MTCLGICIEISQKSIQGWYWSEIIWKISQNTAPWLFDQALLISGRADTGYSKIKNND